MLVRRNLAEVMAMRRCAAATIPFVLAVLAANCGGDADDGGAAGAGHSVGGEGGDAEAGRGGDLAEGGEDSGAGGSHDDGRAGRSTGGTEATGCVGLVTGCNGGDVTPTLDAVAWLQPDSCERFVAYEVRDVRDQDGAAVTDYTCEWTFSDGATSTACTGSKGFGDLPGSYYGTVVVRDPTTGATTTARSEVVTVIEPQALEIFASSFDCMQFEYDIDRQYGCGGTHTLDIQPAENILTPRPWSIHSQTLQVATPGVYTLTYTVEGCAASYARTCVTSTTASVTVAECP